MDTVNPVTNAFFQRKVTAPLEPLVQVHVHHLYRITPYVVWL